MALSDLPVEIILNIADQLDVAGANTLARTNSQMSTLLKGYLYVRDVTNSHSRSLTWAVENGVDATASNSTIQCAVDAGRYLNPMPPNFHIALQEAVFRGYTHLVERLLKVNGINPNFGGHSQKPPLILAAQNGQSTVVELLLTVADIDPNVSSRDDANTPLFYACNKGHISIVKQLLARNDVNLNILGFDESAGWVTPLTTACNHRHVEVINLLLAKDGIDVNFHNTTNRNTALMMAVQKALIDPSMEGVVKSLLARDDVDPNILNSYGIHVLMFSVLCQGRDIAKSLLDRPDVDLNLQGPRRDTALMWALSRYHKVDPEMIKLLLDQEGIDVNCQDTSGYTALHMAVSFNLKAVELLLKRKDVDINLPENNGWTPLSLASKEGAVTVVRLLLRKKGIDPNARDNQGCTPLANVCTGELNNKATRIVRWLLSHPDTDPNSVDNNSVSVLAKVIANDRRRFGNYETIESLLRAAGATVLGKV
jgi:ankyrin repeat protein